MCAGWLHTSLSLSLVFFFKQKTAYDMRISDWSSDVCSSDLVEMLHSPAAVALLVQRRNPLHLVGRDPMRARLAQPPIEQPRRALGLIAHPQPPECPLR